MDSLHAFILILHAKTARDGFPYRYAINRKHNMTPKMQGVAAALKGLRHEIETQASDILSQADKINQRATAAIAEAKKNLADTAAAVGEIEELNASLAGSNGAPTLDGSAPQSAAPSPQAGEPASSWSGSKPV